MTEDTPNKNFKVINKQADGKRQKVFYIFFFLLLGTNLFWLIYLEFYPFIDLPNHLFLASVYKFYHEAGNYFNQFYQFTSLLRSNTFHFFFMQIPLFPGIETANRFFYIIYVISFPVSVLMLIRKLGGNLWFAILSFLLVFNFSVIWGFTGYTMSVPAIMIFYLMVIDFYEIPKRRYVIVMMLLLPVIFFIHFQSALFAILILAVSGIADFRNAGRNLIKKIIIILPVSVLMITVWISSRTESYESLSSYLIKYYSEEYLPSFPQRMANFFILDNYFLFEKAAGWIAGSVVSVFILFPLTLFIISTGKNFREKIKRDLNVYPFIFLVCSAGCFLFLPDNIPGQNMIYERFSVIVLTGVIIFSSVIIGKEFSGKFIKWILMFSVMYMLVLSHYLFEFGEESESFIPQLLPQMSGDKVLAALIYDYEFRGQPVYIHYHAYHTIRNSGITTNGWMDYRFSFLRRKVPMEKLPPHIAWVGSVNAYNNEYDNTDYLLVKDDTLRTFKNFRLMEKSKDWYLLENISQQKIE